MIPGVSSGSTIHGVRRMASLALALALAAPAQLPALAQDAPASAALPPDVGAQKGDDAQTDAAQAGDTRWGNRAETAEPPDGEVQPADGPPVTGAKADDKGVSLESPVDASALGVDVATVGRPRHHAASGRPPTHPVPADQAPSGVAAQLAAWVTRAGDNDERPFAIIDKVAARIFVFDADGRLVGAAPVLVGLATGDDSAAGVGDKALAAISPDERTTPAGRFVAGFGPATGGKTVFWVDYADAISLHPVVTTNPQEHRLKRIKSSAPEDHRISFGCINVPARFYETVVLTAFAGGSAIVYVLPDSRPVEEVFPAFAATTQASAADDHADQAAAEPAAGPAASDPPDGDPAHFDPVQAGDADQAAETQPPTADPAAAPPAAKSPPQHTHRRHHATSSGR